MTPRVFLAAALIATFAGSVLADASIKVIVEPPDPTSNEVVTLRVSEMDSCPPSPRVTRDGYNIRVTLGTGPCLSPPTEIVHRVEIGVLSAGEYTVIVSDDGSTMLTTRFLVRAANHSMTVLPGAGPTTGGTLVAITGDFSCSMTGECPPPTVTFGGTAATVVQFVNDWRVVVRTPAHEAGSVEVRVTRGERTAGSFAFRYYDPDSAPLPASFERILVPLIYNGAGAFGSLWRTEVAVRSSATVPVRLWRPVNGIEEIGNTSTMLNGDPAPAGVFLIAPRDMAATLSFNALVRDVSREATDFGTELPVVRESSVMRGHPVELLNVPSDPRFRHKLRIYSFHSLTSVVSVETYSMTDGRTFASRDVLLRSSEPCPDDGPCGSVRPAYIELDTLPGLGALAPGERFAIRIWVPPWDRIWAFVTITNNETQRLTVISPQ